MKTLVLMVAGLAFAGSLAALPATAQSPTTAPAVKQRAPGVPLAPRTEEARPPGERAVPRADVRAPRDERAQAAPSQPSRDPPMPRPVPSIIAP